MNKYKITNEINDVLEKKGYMLLNLVNELEIDNVNFSSAFVTKTKKHITDDRVTLIQEDLYNNDIKNELIVFDESYNFNAGEILNQDSNIIILPYCKKCKIVLTVKNLNNNDIININFNDDLQGLCLCNNSFAFDVFDNTIWDRQLLLSSESLNDSVTLNVKVIKDGE